MGFSVRWTTKTWGYKFSLKHFVSYILVKTERKKKNKHGKYTNALTHIHTYFTHKYITHTVELFSFCNLNSEWDTFFHTVEVNIAIDWKNSPFKKKMVIILLKECFKLPQHSLWLKHPPYFVYNYRYRVSSTLYLYIAKISTSLTTLIRTLINDCNYYLSEIN